MCTIGLCFHSQYAVTYRSYMYTNVFNEIMTKDISEQIKPDWGQIKHSVLNQWEGLMCQSPFEELTHGVGSLSK